MDFARELVEKLKLLHAPVGIAFRPTAPEGVKHAPAELASCSYWKHASDGAVFWTDAADHQGCPIGAHTHGVQLGEAKKQELMGLVGTMVGLGYLTMEDVPKIPHRTEPMQIAVYAPLGQMPVPADLLLVRGTAAQLMVLVEAAQMAGFAPEAPAMGRPTCAALPQALQSQRPAVSLACIGNRVYTGLEDGEGYVALPAASLEAVAGKLGALVQANAALEKFHRARVSGSPKP